MEDLVEVMLDLALDHPRLLALLLWQLPPEICDQALMAFFRRSWQWDDLVRPDHDRVMLALE